MKILFLDLDDTLLTRQKTISENTRAAIHEALKAGHKVVITTGRPQSGAVPLAHELELDVPGCYLICFNGARIIDFHQNKAIFDSRVKLDYVRHVFQAAKDANIYIHTYDEEGVLTPAFAPEAEWYCTRNKIAWKVDPNLPDTLTEAPSKVILLDRNGPERLEQFRQELLPWAKGKVLLFFSGPELLECVEDGVTKGAAITWLADHLGVPIEDTVAAGDSENDIPMLEAAGVGCAMSNATDACKQAADYITENDCDHDGVAEIIQKILLI